MSYYKTLVITGDKGLFYYYNTNFKSKCQKLFKNIHLHQPVDHLPRIVDIPQKIVRSQEAMKASMLPSKTNHMIVSQKTECGGSVSNVAIVSII